MEKLLMAAEKLLTAYASIGVWSSYRRSFDFRDCLSQNLR